MKDNRKILNNFKSIAEAIPQPSIVSFTLSTVYHSFFNAAGFLLKYSPYTAAPAIVAPMYM